MSATRAEARIAGLLAAVALLAPARAADPAGPVPARLAACAGCHGADGHARQDGVPHLAGQPRLFLENRLVMMREGLSVVPAMKGLVEDLDDAALVALSRHYAAQPRRPERPPREPHRADRGAALSARALCGSCHLPGYVGREQIPRLAGQREDYLLQAMRDFAAGRTAGRDTLMTNALIGLSDADLADLAHHFATLPETPAR